ncbi:MAG: hypothetical protein ABI175_29155 [Polyangiales bacterium]
MRTVHLGAACASLLLLVPTPAHAGIAWGDATLKADDVRVEIDAKGHALVTHRIGIHVAAKRFRAFVVDGVDDGIGPPLDDVTTAGLDGPGWPVSIVDAQASPNDAPIEAFVEPAKEPHRLRVHLGRDGVARGDYVIELKYRVDLAAQGRFVRDGTRVRLTWEAPSWPEGFDSGHLVFVVPAAPSEPQIAMADVGGGSPRSVDGVAIVDLVRSPTSDAITLTRPHVAHHDDTRWVLTFDPKATPELVAALPPDVQAMGSAPPDAPRGPRYWAIAAAVAAGAFAASLLAMKRRDADATRMHASRGVRVRPLLPLGSSVRALLFATALAGGLVLSLGRAYVASATLLVVAIVVSILRAPESTSTARTAGRWLAIPRQAIPRRARAKSAPFDTSTWLGRGVLALVVLACAAGCVLLARRHLDLAVVAAMHLTALLSLFATGKTTQLPPDLACDAWPRLASIARALEKKHGPRLKVVGRVARRGDDGAAPSSPGGIDEVRLRIDPTGQAADRGLLSIEIGCAIVSGLGASALVPELLVRVRHGTTGARALERRLARARASSTFSSSLGRTSDELALSIRPLLTGGGSMRRWVEWVVLAVEAGATESATRVTEVRRAPTRATPSTGAAARADVVQPTASL